MKKKADDFQVIIALGAIIARTLNGKIEWERNPKFLYERNGTLVEKKQQPKLGIRRPNPPGMKEPKGADARKWAKFIEARKELTKNDPGVAKIQTGVDAEMGLSLLYLHEYWESSSGVGNVNTLFVGYNTEELRNNVLKWLHPLGRSQFPLPPNVAACDNSDLTSIIGSAIASITNESHEEENDKEDLDTSGDSTVLLKYANRIN